MLLQIARVGSHQKKLIQDLTGEAAHWEQQIEMMRRMPGYEIMVDPLEIAAKDGHADCKAELNGLRTELVRMRAKKEELFEKNALVNGEIRKLRKSRRALEKAPVGRPSRQVVRFEELRFQLEAYLGYPIPAKSPYAAVMGRHALERLLGLVQEAERLSGQILRLKPAQPVPGAMVPLSSVVAGA